MSNFKLSDGTNIFQLAISGDVQDATGASIGKWTTNKDNQIAIQQEDGQETTIPVHWKFNEENQFCLLDSQQNEVFNFCTIPDIRPKFTLRNAILEVRPANNHPFIFDVRGNWDLNDQHQLLFNCGGVSSILDGILSDKKSRFIYRVRDRNNARINFRLGFAGKWEQVTNDGIPRLRFSYQREADEVGVFEMPADGKLLIENGMNQFRYVYDKDNKTFGITLLGFLKIKENLEISYSLDKQSARNGEELVAATTFTFQAAFSGNQFDGDLGLVLLKEDNTPGDYHLSVTGDYTGVIGETRVMVGFRFSQRRKGHLVTRKFGIGGAFSWEAGQVSYAIDAGGGMVELHLGLDIHLKDGGDLNSKFSLVSADGQVRTITFLLGITF
ncbi:MAG: hypothetical protein AAF960_01825 [Bacteroidota bacterium]